MYFQTDILSKIGLWVYKQVNPQMKKHNVYPG